MPKTLRLSAIVPSRDIDETKKFLVDVLQFEDVKMNVAAPDYAIVKTANTELHLQSSQGDPQEMSMYLLVESVDDFWKLLEDKQGEVKMKAPFVQDYGMKEVHVILPHTNTLLFIGEDIG